MSLNMEADLTDLIGVMEEVVEMTGINRKYNPPVSKIIPPREIIRDNNKPSVPVPRRETTIECWICKDKGHKSPDCPLPRRKVNYIHVESESEEDPPSDFNIIPGDEEETVGDVLVINGDIGDDSIINIIHGESHLPQKWDFSEDVGHISDAKMLANKPEEGKGYTTGQTSYTTVLYNNFKIKTLLDIGAFCSCTSLKFIEKICPEWKSILLPIPKARFSSCNASLKPLGIISLLSSC